MPSPKPKTNRQALRQILRAYPQGGGPDLCEYDPLREMPARLKDRYHGEASVPVTLRGEAYRVCQRCAEFSVRLNPGAVISAILPGLRDPQARDFTRTAIRGHRFGVYVESCGCDYCAAKRRGDERRRLRQGAGS